MNLMKTPSKRRCLGARRPHERIMGATLSKPACLVLDKGKGPEKAVNNAVNIDTKSCHGYFTSAHPSSAIFQTRNRTDPVKDGTFRICACATINNTPSKAGAVLVLSKTVLAPSRMRMTHQGSKIANYADHVKGWFAKSCFFTYVYCTPSWAHARIVRLQPAVIHLILMSRVQNTSGSAHSWNMDLTHESQQTLSSKRIIGFLSELQCRLSSHRFSQSGAYVSERYRTLLSWLVRNLIRINDSLSYAANSPVAFR